MSLSKLIIATLTACLFGYAVTLFQPAIELKSPYLMTIAAGFGFFTGWVLKHAYGVTGQDLAE
jgi:ABC-type antimicrobial peptide transport system permease subunit